MRETAFIVGAVVLSVFGVMLPVAFFFGLVGP